MAGGEKSLVTRDPVNFMNLFDFRMGHSIPLATLDQPTDRDESDIMLIENFR